MAEGAILVAAESAMFEFGGRKVFLVQGRTTVRDGHPILKGREKLFRLLAVDFETEQNRERDSGDGGDDPGSGDEDVQGPAEEAGDGSGPEAPAGDDDPGDGDGSGDLEDDDAAGADDSGPAAPAEQDSGNGAPPASGGQGAKQAPRPARAGSRGPRKPGK